jgi:predicted dehydrogenase
MERRSEKTRVAVVGVGHLGKEHARICSTLPGVELVGVVDADLMRAQSIAAPLGTEGYDDVHPILDRVDAAIIAAPTRFHHLVAAEFLRKGVSLLIEKPLASSEAEAVDLVRLASGVILAVGHIERFNPAFEEIQSRGMRPRWINCERMSGFSGRSTDVGAVLDLMIHDIDLVLSLNASAVIRVEAQGAAILGGHEDIARARLSFANGCVADLSVSRVHPEPIRRMQVWGSEGWISADFATRKVTLRQPTVELRQSKIDSRKLDAGLQQSLRSELHPRYLESVEIDCSKRYSKDQLTRELEDFVEAVRRGGEGRVSGRAGLEAMEVASRILEKIRTFAWEGRQDGPTGALGLPSPRVQLFTTGREAA